MLLCHRKGPLSFEDLRTVDGVVCETYLQACHKLGLLDNNQYYEENMAEATSLITNMETLRHYFCILLMNCEIPDPYHFFKSNLEGSFN